MKQNDWTSQMRRRLADREVSVPDDLWDKIEARLDAGSGCAAKGADRRVGVVGAHGRRGVRIALWAASAAAAVALLVVAGYRANEDTIRRLAADNHAAAAKSPASAVASARAVERAVGGGACAGEAWRGAPSSSGRGLLAAAGVSAADVGVAECAASPEVALPVDTDERRQQVVTHSAPADRAERVEPRNNARKEPLPLMACAAEPRQERYSSARFTIGAHTGGSMTDSRSSDFPAQRALKASSFFAGNSLVGQDMVGGYMASYNAALLSKYKEVKHHAQPLSVGISVGFALTDRLSLTSGVVYTRAVTDFIRLTGADDIVETQKLHYVGVPLALKYRVWGTRLVHTYATVGGEADFNVAARTTAGDVRVDTGRDRAQFSVNAAAGVQVDVVPQVGVYAEPGVKYYFDNKSKVETLFKDKPWAFNLNVGLRINLY